MGESIPVTWTLANVSTTTLNIVAYHRAGGGPQYDELNVSVSRNGGAERQIPLVAPRAATQTVWRQLAPEGQLRQLFDLAHAMESSGYKPEPGQYRLTMTYSLNPTSDNDGQPGWSGHVSALPVSFEIYL